MNTLGTDHFMGSLVLNMEDEHRPQVIDGQQRLTTLLTLLALIRDEYARIDSPFANRAHSHLVSDSYASGDKVFKFRTGEANWKPFRDFVLRPSHDAQRLLWENEAQLPKEVRARNRALFDNAARLRSRLQNYLADRANNDRIAALEAMENTIVLNLDFVAIKVHSVADAFLLFETLNDRGLQLSAADLLKSHLLARVASARDDETAVREAAEEWDELINDLGGAVDITRFLRHYLLIQTPSVRKDDVFSLFKGEVVRLGPIGLLQHLRAMARLYGEFVDPGRVEDKEVRSVLRDLETLRATTCYSMLMPARRFLSSADFVGIARLAEILTYRYSTIVGLDSKELERIYHRAAKAIDTSKGADLEAARRELMEVMPGRELFIQSFLRQRMGKHYLVHYTLGRIEHHITAPGEKELRENAVVHIEHVMPTTLTEDWRAVLGARVEEHPEYLNRWGNLTLLYSTLNIAASNSSFSVKKKGYRCSEVHLTQKLCEQPAWGLAQIEARQQWMAEVAERIWSVDAPEGRRVSLPEPTPYKLHLSDFLPAEEVDRFEPLCSESTSEEVLRLKGRVEAHAGLLEEASRKNEFLDRSLAKRVAEVLATLIDNSADLDADGRALLRGAVEYFVLTTDADDDISSPIGIEDDARVVNVVCEVLGRTDIKVVLP